jgi:tripartite-type tricarboxylate transporter receptor subunit TctC
MIEKLAAALAPWRRMALGLVLAACAGAAPAIAADYPERPIRLVVPASPGGPGDILARIVAEPLGESLGQPILIENRAGGGASIGIGVAAAAKPDGYTLLFASTALVVNPSLRRHLPWSVGSFAPVAKVASSPSVVVAGPSQGIRSMADLLARAKKTPGQITYGTPGVGTTPQLAMEFLKQAADINIRHIPFAGAAPALNAVLNGEVALACLALPTAEGKIRSGQVIALAVTGPDRWPDLPEVPTLAEAGITGAESDVFAGNFQGVLAPAGTPAAIVDRLASATLAVLGRPEVQGRIRQIGFAVSPRGPEAFAGELKSGLAGWQSVIKKAGIEPN